MTTTLKDTPRGLINRLSNIIYSLVKPFGLSYPISYLIKYQKKHDIAHFSGSLVKIKSEFSGCDDETKAKLTKQFENIVDALVLNNGVRKTTYASRQNAAMSSLCNNEIHRINKKQISVLDIPSSVGLSSIDMYNMLSEKYDISKYMLADQYFEVLYDETRGCIFDELGDLLQVRFKKQFFSIYRPHTAGDAFGIAAYILLSPLNLLTYYLRKKYIYNDDTVTTKLLLIHPEAEELINQGIFSYKKTDVFSKIEGKYDLILSFNLLQRNYFSETFINTGIKNLTDALNDNGIVVMGNTESYNIHRKLNGKLVLLESIGQF